MIVRHGFLIEAFPMPAHPESRIAAYPAALYGVILLSPLAAAKRTIGRLWSERGFGIKVRLIVF
jgi:hypothetical protein